MSEAKYDDVLLDFNVRFLVRQAKTGFSIDLKSNQHVK